MSYRETLPRRGIARKQMMKRVARFSRLKGFDGGLPDSRMPGCERILYNVIGFQPPKTERGGKQSPVGAEASRLAAIKVREGFNLGYCRALPGKGPMLHNHDTNETFIAMTGTWRASWQNRKGRLEHVDLKPLDVISFPPGASRRFMNVTRGPKHKHSILMFVIGGDAPSAEFTSESMDELERKGRLAEAQGREEEMKAPAFAYAKPATLAEAFDLLQNPNAKILAGGQSLIPSLNMRLSSPELLVDITGLQDLSGISIQGSSVRIGALTTHAQIEKSTEIRKHVPLLAQAVPHIAHAAIRNRGTIGGSLALADPAAEYPACAIALDSVFVIKNKSTERRVKAGSFFKGLFETDLKPGEILTAVEFPVASKSDRSVFLELARRQGDYAIIGLAAHNGSFVYFGTGSVPFVLKGFSDKDKAKSYLNENLKPSADLYNSAAAKLHLAGVLLERAWNTPSH